MALQFAGANGTVVQANVEHQAARVESRPMDSAGLGAYAYSGFTGILPAALGANSEIFQFRWTDATRFCVIRKIRISASVSTTFFAAGVPLQIDLVKSTAWTVQGTGGTGVTPAALLKKRTSMASTLVATGDIRIATTAALGAGTKTLETLSLAAVAAACPITSSLNGTIIAPGTILFQNEVANGEYPLILAQNEGVSIRSVAVPATGTWTASVEVQWAEVSSY
jgi:hypothetical protein